MFAAAFKKLPFSKKSELLRTDHIFLVRGPDASGTKAWYYVLIDKGKRDAFMARAGIPFLKLTDFGQVLFSGFGENPPADVQAEMAEDYGYTEALAA